MARRDTCVALRAGPIAVSQAGIIGVPALPCQVGFPSAI